MSEENVQVPDLIDDKPDEVKSDLRKFNKAEDQVNKALAALSTITVITDAAGVDSAMEIMKTAKKVETVIENKRKDLVKPYNDEVKRINDYAKGLIAKIPPAIDKAKGVLLTYQQAEETRLKKLRTTARKEQLIALGFVEETDRFVHGTGVDQLLVRLSEVENLPDTGWPVKLAIVTDELEAKTQKQITDLMEEKEAASFFGEPEETAAIDQKIESVKSTPVPAAAASYIPSFGSSKVKGLTKRWTFEVTDAAQVPRQFLQVDEKKIREAIASGERSIAGVRIYQDESISLR